MQEKVSFSAHDGFRQAQKRAGNADKKILIAMRKDYHGDEKIFSSR